MTELTNPVAMDWLWCETDGFVPMHSPCAGHDLYAVFIDRPHQHVFTDRDMLGRFINCEGCDYVWVLAPTRLPHDTPPCPHPMAERKNLGWGTTRCLRCGNMVR